MSGSTSDGNSFAQQIANYISQNQGSSGSVANVSAEAANYGSQLAASYIAAGIQNLENFLGGLNSSSSNSSSGSSSSSSGSSSGSSGFNLNNLIQAGINNLGIPGLGSSSSNSSSGSSSSSSSGFNLPNLIQMGINEVAPQLNNSSSSGSSSSGSSSSGSLNSLISAGIQQNLPAGVSVSGSSLNFPAITTPFGSINVSLQNGVPSVTPSSSS